MPKRRLTAEELAASKARAQTKRDFRRLWSRSDATLDELAEEVGMTEAEAVAYAKSLGLSEHREPDFYLPTPEQIRIAAEEIRKSWTQEELEARRENVSFDRLTTEAYNDAI